MISLKRLYSIVLVCMICLLPSIYVYAGCISGNCENGYGTYIWPSGGKYVGEWRDKYFNGYGTKTWADGRIEKGIWEKGKFVKAGTKPDPLKDKYTSAVSTSTKKNYPKPEKKKKTTFQKSEPFSFINEKLVMKSLTAPMGVNQQLAAALSDVIIDTLSQHSNVQSMDALAAINSLVEKKLKAGCDETKCIIEVAGAMDIGQVVTGKISKLGDTYRISLMLIQTKGDNLGVIQRASEECECTEGELIDVTKRAALKLIGLVR